MSSSRYTCELLSPAGNFDSLKAAVENGADAVYLGGKLYNARQFAGNFSDDEMLRALEYAHLRGVKLYLTLNTLLRDHEIGRALEYAAFMREQGIDAIIVQDLGLAAELRRQMPDLPLHASTQMTIYNLKGVELLRELGFRRVVTARELSLGEIREITTKTDMEIEVFIHGALCVSYSGQCLMSSMIGGRSGNRGTCAQNCRMRYGLYDHKDLKLDEGYLLSTRDMNTIRFLEAIVKAGVKSLKIEGRMKTPEYVGLVTSKYRKALDYIFNSENPAIDQQDEKELAQVFNRGGFSRGYFYGKNPRELIFAESPKNMGIPLGTAISYDEKKFALSLRLEEAVSMGDGVEVLNGDNTLPGGIVTEIRKDGKNIRQAQAGDIVTLSRIKIHEKGSGKGHIRQGDKVVKTSSRELTERIAASFARAVNSRRKAVTGIMTIKAGEPARLRLSDPQTGIEVLMEGAVPEKAVSKGLLPDRVREQLTKTGDLPFYFSSLELEIDDGLHLPVSSINDIRRKAFESLSEAILDYYRRDRSSIPALIPKSAPQKPGDQANNIERYISLYFFVFEKLREMYERGVIGEADRVYLPLAFFMDEEKRNFISSMKNHLPRVKILAALPNIIRGEGYRFLDKLIPDLLDLGLVHGLMAGNLGALRWNIKQDILLAGDIGLNAYNSTTMKLLEELGLDSQTFSPELKPNEIPVLKKGEYIVYGRIPVMTIEHNPVARAGKLVSRDYEGYYLKNPRNDKFPLLFDLLGDRTVVFSAWPLEIGEEGIRQLLEKGINGFRVNIFHESPEEIRRIIRKVKNIVRE